MFKKKMMVGVVMLVTVAFSASMFAAFEAHVINVTAKIENALTVNPEEIMFGTVFPQEHLERNLTIALSSSFTDTTRVDDVEYVIKQKPKVKGDPYATIYPADFPNGIVAHEYCLNEEPVDATDPSDPYYDNCYPVLCEYLSKHKAESDDDMPTDVAPYDTEIDAFHDMSMVANGYLVKSVDDKVDEWIIDLAVPCFEGQCDQTYDEWVWSINPNVENPWDWALPAGMESETFGCDLWIEVTGISENVNTCNDEIDNDGDGLIDYPEDPDCSSPYDTE